MRGFDRTGAAVLFASGILALAATFSAMASGTAETVETKTPTAAAGAAGSVPAEAAATPAPNPGQAAAQLSFREQLLATGVRILVESTVQNIDLEAAKLKAVEKIRRRPEEVYQLQMKQIFEDLGSVDVHDVLGVTRQSSKQDVIAAIQSTSKPDLLGALNAIPDKAIAELLDRKLRESGATSLVEAHQYFDKELRDLVTSLSPSG